MAIPQSLLNTNWDDPEIDYRCRTLEARAFVEYIGPPDPNRNYKNGPLPDAGNYLLIDEGIIGNQGWSDFLEAIFYIGKGIRTRPNFHFIETRNFLEENNRVQPQKKIRTIAQIWERENGVFSVYFFGGCMHEAALIKESLMIGALCPCKLTNCTSHCESYYGESKRMTPEERALLGGFLLHEVWRHFNFERERGVLIPYHRHHFPGNERVRNRNRMNR